MTTRMKRKISRLRSAASLLLIFASVSLAQGSKKAAAPHAVVSGTVFRDPGFAQPGASVVLTLKSAPAKKLQDQVSSTRGEFTFRVPPGPQTYVVTATLKGFQTVRQEIEIQDQEQINATLLLVPESKNKER
jgi:hypothetical protein